MSALAWVLVGGVALLVLTAVLAWGTDVWDDEIDGQRVVLHALPGAGLILVGASAGELVPALLVPGVVLLLAGIAVLVLAIPHPTWWGPRWYRQRRRERGATRPRRRS